MSGDRDVDREPRDGLWGPLLYDLFAGERATWAIQGRFPEVALSHDMKAFPRDGGTAGAIQFRAVLPDGKRYGLLLPAERYARPTQAGSFACLACGKETHVAKGFGAHRKYRSPACGSKACRKTAKHRRRVRIQGLPSEVVTIEYLIERDKGVRQRCRKRVDRIAIAPHPLSPTIDHVIPLSKGGAHTKANTQLAHLRCNVLKSDRVDTLF